MRVSRDSVIVALVWVIATVLLELVFVNADLFPKAGAEEARHLDGAFRLLVLYAVPVFTFVVVVLGYSVFRFRARGADEEGEPIFGSRLFSVSWLVGTAALAVLLFAHPGVTGVFFLNRDTSGDLVVRVTAAQWHWHVEYPQYDLEIKSSPTGWERMDKNAVLALPVHRRVRFEVTSVDVIHSFWIPAFRLKQDAVPGRVMTLYVTPDATGTFEADSAFRVQCAELCGTGHPYMNMPVKVMEPEEFEEWVQKQKEMAEMGGMDMGGDMNMGKKDDH